MIDNYSVWGDIPFRDAFTFHTHRDPYRAFHSSYNRFPATGMSDTLGKRSGAREVIIPIHVEGRDQPVIPKVHHHIDLTEENYNNSGLHNHSRARRRHQSSHHRHGSEGGKSTSGGVSHFPILPNSQYERTSMSENRPRSESPDLSQELIDLCMYEDMWDSDTPDCYISESIDEISKSSRDKSDISSKSDCQITDVRSKPTSKIVTPTPSYTVYSLLKSQLAKDGRLIDYIRGDGNCFFRALSKDIYGSEDFHQEVRQAVVDLIEKYSKEFEQFLDSGLTIVEHIKDMRRDATWATSAEIYAAATLLQREIYVLSPDHTGEAYNWMLFEPRFVYTQDTSYHPCFITLCHTHGNHYDRITPRDSKCNCDHDPPVLSGVKAYVDLTK